MTKKPTYKEKDTLRERGKKRFLERQIEQEEAEKEIKQYQPEEQEYPTNDDKIQNKLR